MNRKVGDKVKIISSEKASGLLDFVKVMNEYCGKEAIIKRKVEYEGKIYYKIDLDKQFFFWTNDMFEKEEKGLLKNE